jgi:hypothetical protein
MNGLRPAVFRPNARPRCRPAHGCTSGCSLERFTLAERCISSTFFSETAETGTFLERVARGWCGQGLVVTWLGGEHRTSGGQRANELGVLCGHHSAISFARRTRAIFIIHHKTFKFLPSRLPCGRAANCLARFQKLSNSAMGACTRLRVLCGSLAPQQA